jgi:Lrp/AsnC family transcriptional regulator, leucine-responsive regulatory protein
MIDDIDLQILNILQQNARTSNAEIARQVEMAPSAVLERIRRLEARGVIQGYEVRINPEALGQNLLAFIFVRSADFDSDLKTAEVLAAIPEVLEAHHIAGEDCYLLKVRTRDAKALGRLLRERIGTTGSVQSSRTTIVLETLREGSRLPLFAPAIPREALEEGLDD